MTRKRRRFSPEFKAKVARAALREDKTLNELTDSSDWIGFNSLRNAISGERFKVTMLNRIA